MRMKIEHTPEKVVVVPAETVVRFDGMWGHLYREDEDYRFSLTPEAAAWLDATGKPWKVVFDLDDATAEMVEEVVLTVADEEMAAAFVRAFGGPAEDYWFPSEDGIFIGHKAEQFMKDGRPREDMLAWLERKAPGFRLAETDRFDAKWPVWRLDVEGEAFRAVMDALGIYARDTWLRDVVFVDMDVPEALWKQVVDLHAEIMAENPDLKLSVEEVAGALVHLGIGAYEDGTITDQDIRDGFARLFPEAGGAA
jgi:hypothetical protein